jgi:hypothetical protein
VRTKVPPAAAILVRRNLGLEARVAVAKALLIDLDSFKTCFSNDLSKARMLTAIGQTNQACSSSCSCDQHAISHSTPASMTTFTQICSH